jgi:hypothetical protein
MSNLLQQVSSGLSLWVSTTGVYAARLREAAFSP